MHQRFEQYQNKFQARKERIEKKLNEFNKPITYRFYNERPLVIKLHTMDAFLEHLKEYEKTTRSLAKSNPENAEFYKAHLKQVVSLLENIENKLKENPDSLLPEDFKLIVPSTVQYNMTGWDTFINIFKFCLGGLGVGAGILALVGFIGGMVFGIMASTPSAGAAVGYLLIGFSVIGAAAGAIVGALAGAVIGLLVGVFVGPCLDKPFKNPYVDGTAFDCDLLRNAYIELTKNAGANDIGANDEDMEPNTRDDLTQSL